MKFYKRNEDLSFTSIKAWGVLPLVGLCLFAMAFGGYFIAHQIQEQIKPKVVIDTVFINTDTLEFTPENLKMVIKELGIHNPDVVYKQAVLETGNFKSRIFLENNNCFGFKVFPRKWEGVQMPFQNRSHLVFKNWAESVEQYKLWQEANFTDKDYARHLIKKGYAEDPNYFSKITK